MYVASCMTNVADPEPKGVLSVYDMSPVYTQLLRMFLFAVSCLMLSRLLCY